MKRLLISLLAAAIISLVIPLVIVELAQPDENAASTETQETEPQATEEIMDVTSE